MDNADRRERFPLHRGVKVVVYDNLPIVSRNYVLDKRAFGEEKQWVVRKAPGFVILNVVFRGRFATL